MKKCFLVAFDRWTVIWYTIKDSLDALLSIVYSRDTDNVSIRMQPHSISIKIPLKPRISLFETDTFKKLHLIKNISLE